jgi:lysophospholipase L1-like esterase
MLRDGNLRIIRLAAVAALSVVCATCGAKSPIGPPGGVLGVSCPQSIDVNSSDGNAVTVAYDQPQTTNGLAPVTTTCSMTSGSAFPVGASTVSCQARDAASQSASCSFSVRVHAPPTLQYTKYLAFGDSITEGSVSQSIAFLKLDLATSYPARLRGLLRARYTQQATDVLNEGVGGETVAGDGLKRFRSNLLQNRPEVVMIMEGSNDLLSGSRGAEDALIALDLMMKEAESQNIKVCLATLPPQRAGGLKHRDAVAGSIPGFNDQVRALAASHSAVLVDVYAGMKDDLSLIGIDDLHPTEHGYEVMAQIYFDAIKAAFEVKDPASAMRLLR